MMEHDCIGENGETDMVLMNSAELDLLLTLLWTEDSRAISVVLNQNGLFLNHAICSRV